jgi:hypothetical protein
MVIYLTEMRDATIHCISYFRGHFIIIIIIIIIFITMHSILLDIQSDFIYIPLFLTCSVSFSSW